MKPPSSVRAAARTKKNWEPSFITQLLVSKEAGKSKRNAAPRTLQRKKHRKLTLGETLVGERGELRGTKIASVLMVPRLKRVVKKLRGWQGQRRGKLKGYHQQKEL